MKFHKLISLIVILTTMFLLLTGCRNSNSYVSDQQGRKVSVTASDSDTYTFKLPAATALIPDETDIKIIEETIPEEPETTAEIPAEESETTAEIPAEEPETPAIPEEVPEEEPITVAPKTGEF